MIPQDIIQSINNSAKIVDVVSEFLQLKKQGANYTACCPFHNEKSPSFIVSPAKGTYKCFGCGESGNAITFVMKHENVSYPKALEYIADKLNITIPKEKPAAWELEKYGKIESFKNIIKIANNYFSENINNQVAQDYLNKRNINKDTIEIFKIGYAINDWQSLLNYTKNKGFSEHLLIDTGLAKFNNKYYDYFRNRIMFPFFDLSGNIIGFTGREIEKKENQAKYLNSTNSIIFNKSKILFGLFQAKKDIVSNNFVYLVEGNIDVVSLHQKGIRNVVASSGTALSIDQANLLFRFTNNLIIIYDGDSAGIKATFSAIDLLFEKGFFVRAVVLDKDTDPDNLCQKYTEKELKDYLKKNEKDFIDLKYEILISENQDDINNKTIVAKEIINTINLISDKISKEFYIRKCQEKFNIDNKFISKFIVENHKLEKISDTNIVGLNIAENEIRKQNSLYLTFNKNKLIEYHTDNRENTILINSLSKTDIQNLFTITENIVFIDEFISLIENDFEESYKVKILVELYLHKFNIQVYRDDPDESDISFFDYYISLYKNYIYQNPGNDKSTRLALERVAELLSHSDNTFIAIYTPECAKQFAIKESAFNKILKPYLDKKKSNTKMKNEGIITDGEVLQFDPEKLPDYVDIDFFRRFGYFPAQNSKGLKVSYVFRTDYGGLQTIGNFYMEPLFHVYDKDKQKNKRIVKINNGEQNKTFYIEMLSDVLIDFNIFKKAMWREGGNVFTRAKPIHLEMINASLANQFPLCFELNEFGQQHENFYAFANAIFSENEIKYTDELGLVEHNEVMYYSPAFSKIYSGQRKSADRYENDRFFIYKDCEETNFEKWTELMNSVYSMNDNGKWAIIFAILAAFRSDIYYIDRLFTSLFFIGPTESGKTQIAISIRSLFMSPEAPLFNLNSGTDAAFFSTLERYRDVPVIFEEYNDYQISDVKFQGLKAAVYDGEGKTKKKDATSKDLDISKVNGVPILLGQESPERDDGSLGNRCVICNVPKKNDWTEEERKLFQELKHREKNGLTSILIEILKLRKMVKKTFQRTQREVFNELKKVIKVHGIVVENRIVNTVSLFTAMAKILEDHAHELKLPFTYSEFFDICKNKIIAQSETIQSSNRLSVFFETIEVLVLRELILAGRDFKIEICDKITLQNNTKETYTKMFDIPQKLLFLRLNNIHTHYMRLRSNEALKIQNLMTYLKDYPAYVGNVKNKRFRWQEVKEGISLNGYREKQVKSANAVTSAIVLDYNIIKEMVNIDLEKYKF